MAPVLLSESPDDVDRLSEAGPEAAASDAALEKLLRSLRSPRTARAGEKAEAKLRTLAHPEATPRLLQELPKAITELERADVALAETRKAARRTARKSAEPLPKKGRRISTPDVERAEEARKRAAERVGRLLRVLGGREDRFPETVAALVPLVRHPLKEVAREAASALETVAGWLRDVEPAHREPAVRTLMELRADDTLPPRLRREVAALLPAHAHKFQEAAVEFVRVNLRYREPWMSEATLEALERMGPRAQGALPDLFWAIRLGRCFLPFDRPVLKAIDPSGETAIPLLIDVLHTERSYRMEAMAALALGHYGPKARAAIPLLREMVEDGVSFGEDRERVREALATIRGEWW